jgi:hypothetical protein
MAAVKDPLFRVALNGIQNRFRTEISVWQSGRASLVFKKEDGTTYCFLEALRGSCYTPADAEEMGARLIQLDPASLDRLIAKVEKLTLFQIVERAIDEGVTSTVAPVQAYFLQIDLERELNALRNEHFIQKEEIRSYFQAKKKWQETELDPNMLEEDLAYFSNPDLFPCCNAIPNALWFEEHPAHHLLVELLKTPPPLRHHPIAEQLTHVEEMGQIEPCILDQLKMGQPLFGPEATFQGELKALKEKMQRQIQALKEKYQAKMAANPFFKIIIKMEI